MSEQKPARPMVDLPRLSAAVSRLVSQDEHDPTGWAGNVLAEILEAVPFVKADVYNHLSHIESAGEHVVGDFQVDAEDVRSALSGVEMERAELYVDALTVAANAEIDEEFDWSDIDRLGAEAQRLDLGMPKFTP